MSRMLFYKILKYASIKYAFLCVTFKVVTVRPRPRGVLFLANSNLIPKVTSLFPSGSVPLAIHDSRQASEGLRGPRFTWITVASQHQLLSSSNSYNQQRWYRMHYGHILCPAVKLPSFFINCFTSRNPENQTRLTAWPEISAASSVFLKWFTNGTSACMKHLKVVWCLLVIGSQSW